MESEEIHKAIHLVTEFSQRLKMGGFRLTTSPLNLHQDIESILESERVTSVKNLGLDHPLEERVLGGQWCIASETCGFKIVVKDRPPTRRGILSVVSSIYDPLGFIAPSIFPAKVLLQDLCRKKLDWDDRIPEEGVSRWESWLKEFPKLEQFHIERCFKTTELWFYHILSTSSLFGRQSGGLRRSFLSPPRNHFS